MSSEVGPFTCSLCKETLRNPISLFCSHSFCEMCFRPRLSQKTCPTCHRATVVDASSLRVNLALRTAVNMFAKRTPRAKHIQTSTTSTSGESESTTATSTSTATATTTTTATPSSSTSTSSTTSPTAMTIPSTWSPSAMEDAVILPPSPHVSSLSPATKHVFDQAMQNVVAGRHDTGIEQLLLVCEMEPYGPAMNNIGWVHFISNAPVIAAHWFRQGSAVGCPFAACNLGTFYHCGMGGIKQNYTEAVRLYRYAADRGIGAAALLLSAMYDREAGGLSYDEDKSADWFQVGVDASTSDNLRSIAREYVRTGVGKPVGRILLDAVMRIRARSWSPYKLYSRGLGINYAPNAVDPGLHLSSVIGAPGYEWTLSSTLSSGGTSSSTAVGGGGGAGASATTTTAVDKVGTTSGGSNNTKNQGPKRNMYLGAALVRMAAADSTYLYAVNTIGYYYCIGRGVKQNLSKAVHYYQAAVDAGEVYAKCNLGVLLLFGLGTPKNEALAVKYFRESAEGGSLAAGYVFWAYCYTNGLGGLQKSSSSSDACFVKAKQYGKLSNLAGVGQDFVAAGMPEIGNVLLNAVERLRAAGLSETANLQSGPQGGNEQDSDGDNGNA